jgi:multidrug efflux pump subunit AcrB
MWIVFFALRYKYTIAVFAILIALFGVLSIKRMSTDIMPRVDSPEMQVVWSYGGLNASEMAAKVTSFSEIAILNNVDDLLEVRSETLNGVALVKIRFQPDVIIERALAQVTGVSQTIIRRMPAGTVPPLIVQTSPSSVPILQLVISSNNLSDGALTDWARLTLRAQIQSIPGIRLSAPYGGANRQIMVDLDPDALNAFGLSATDVSRAIATQNLTLPSGSLRAGNRDLSVALNASPATIAEFLDLPVRNVDGRLVLLRDVANVRDGEAVSTNITRLNGQNAVMVTVLKLGSASTLDIVSGILARLPAIRASAPEGLKIEPIFDQSIFVRASIDNILKEIVLVGALVALVVLLFLGSWRSTVIVLTSIPLALLCSVIGLGLVGATFNLMTLGGLALAIGILVDNALVEIENIKRQIASGKPVRQSILDGARQVAFPEFVSTLGICIVFLPVFLLSGTAAFVFKPLALAVIFAMVASYVLSRTLVPVLAALLLPAEARIEAAASAANRPPHGLRRIHHAIEHALDDASARQRSALDRFLARRWLIPVLVLGVSALGALAWKSLGRDFFPATDAGLIRVFLRFPGGTRIEETARRFADVQNAVRATLPAKDLQFVVENIGLPIFVNLAWVESTAIGPYDGELLIQLAPDHSPSADHMAALRTLLAEKFPDVQAFFRPADATSQTLSGGAPTAFEFRFIGRDVPGNLALANRLRQDLGSIPGVVDITLRQALGVPEYFIEIDRVRAARFGVSQQDASNTLLTALGSGGSVAPTYWSDPKLGISFDVQVQVPPARFRDIEQLLSLPVRPSGGGAPVLLGAFAKLSERPAAANISRTTLLPTYTVLANVQRTDLGAVLDRLDPVLAGLRKDQKPGNRIELAGQAALMQSAYGELLGGLALAAALVFLVMVVNFQSWSLPLAAISGLPLAISGAFFALWITGTSLSIPALMGLIMVVGVSTANSVLVTSFARDLWVAGESGARAAVTAAATRLRPVCMTALAMILGVLPMALGHGEGGEQNAPLGRAVIGGLLLGTVASLFVVPFMFSVLKRSPAPPADNSPDTLSADS